MSKLYKTIGLIGYGSLAKKVEKLALAFDMRVLVAERKNSIEIRAGRTEFDQLLKQVDVLSIHCPLTEHTENLISAREFNLLKPTALLINTARGGVVNETELLSALMEKRLAAAATDVLCQEPPAGDYPLIEQQPDNLIITPHIAWASVQARTRLLAQLVEHVRYYLICSSSGR